MLWKIIVGRCHTVCNRVHNIIAEFSNEFVIPLSHSAL